VFQDTKDSQLKNFIDVHVRVQRVVRVHGRMNNRSVDDIQTTAQCCVCPVNSERSGGNQFACREGGIKGGGLTRDNQMRVRQTHQV